MNRTYTKTKVLLVEDNYNLSENIKEILTLQGYEISEILDEAENALSSIKKILPDVVLLDIKLKGIKTGIELAEEIRESINIPIVFLTSSSGSDVVKKVKHICPDGFITKPFTTNTLLTSIELAVENHKFNSGKASAPEEKQLTDLFIRENGWLKKILICDISWIKAEGTYTHIFVNEKQYTLRNTVKDLMQKLPANQFSRIHKSYIVNMKKVEALSSTAVKIEDMEIPIGRNYYQALLKNINKLSN
ncbi:LytR/AlgR family response regulator transcription factor [Algoriphagus aquimarinus]|uniref:DNA-binding response regulator, LytR/AlgR family n=1 Tax=Algoriphagus aquimarinus TaxID=237018 RepID=A0A1I1BS77_9BACT|nr:response regulator transcription factor [Algoriphagus aquimarinus]SFB53294.1 DNA-binding response regulator, LytR/AlgR family [Algoriphagus aquimarinus]